MLAIWNNQDVNPKIETLERIAKALGVKVQDLFADGEEQSTAQVLGPIFMA